MYNPPGCGISRLRPLGYLDNKNPEEHGRYLRPWGEYVDVSLIKASDFPLFSRARAAKSARTQFGALCFRGSGKKTEVLLITSRDTGRWVIPKGWPKGLEQPMANVTREAWEEAGVTGKLGKELQGFYSYSKVMDDGMSMPCVVAVYPIRVEKMAETFPERGQRRRKWFSPKKAASRVAEPELAKLLRNFRG